ncbi:hypothetical protein [Bauldia litoralis]|uniref:Uncharacterized protein n=1 Tax=Bauldia litoralis TaxID=665467 RepID=A0A1G6AEM8_9HYPH|nr:hypothetical protein [Bauldia litoralis]SDB06832.1 hypothetical protein SAMN02982931_00516 [Bauldia litoralis]
MEPKSPDAVTAPMSAGDTSKIYVVWVGEPTQSSMAEGPDVAVLADGLFLVRTDQTQSQLYHAVKRRLAPKRLLVARADGHPKFKGMEAGALKWLRAGG